LGGDEMHQRPLRNRLAFLALVTTVFAAALVPGGAMAGVEQLGGVLRGRLGG